MTSPDNYRVSKLLPYSLGTLLLEAQHNCESPTFYRQIAASHHSMSVNSFQGPTLTVCSFSSFNIYCSIKALCNILYKTSDLHLFILTLTRSEAQEALRLLTFGQNLGGSLSLFVIRHNSRFSIYRRLLLHHPITSVIRHLISVLLFDRNWHRHYSASFGIDQYCSVSFGIPLA